MAIAYSNVRAIAIQQQTVVFWSKTVSKRVRKRLDTILVLLTVDKQSILDDIDMTTDYYDDLYDRVSRLHDLLLLKELSN